MLPDPLSPFGDLDTGTHFSPSLNADIQLLWLQLGLGDNESYDIALSEGGKMFSAPAAEKIESRWNFSAAAHLLSDGAPAAALPCGLSGRLVPISTAATSKQPGVFQTDGCESGPLLRPALSSRADSKMGSLWGAGCTASWPAGHVHTAAKPRRRGRVRKRSRHKLDTIGEEHV